MPPDTISTNYKSSDHSVKDIFSRRAKSKFITQTIATRLAKIDRINPQKWRRVLDCSSEIRRGEDQSLKTWYCENRACITCCKIKTAVNINRYREQVNEMRDRKFMTLTIPSPNGDNLKFQIRNMIRHFQLIKKRIKKRYGISNIEFPYSLDYIRKLETTCNKDKETYHPHFHFIISDFFVITERTEFTTVSKNITSIFIDEWMRDFPQADRRAQDCRKATEQDVKELFKYFTKTIYKNKNGKWMLPRPDQFLTMMNSIEGTRTFQTGGDIHIPEELRSKYLKDRSPESIIYKDSDKLSGESFSWDQKSMSFLDHKTGEIIGTYEGSGKLIKLFIDNKYYPRDTYKYKDLPKRLGVFTEPTPEMKKEIERQRTPEEIRESGSIRLEKYEGQTPEEIRASCTFQLVNKLVRRNPNFYINKNTKFVKNEFRGKSPEFLKFYKEYLNERMKKLCKCN